MDTLVGTTTISKLFYLPSKKGLLFGANSFLIEQTHFQKGFYTSKSKQEVAKVVSFVNNLGKSTMSRHFPLSEHFAHILVSRV